MCVYKSINISIAVFKVASVIIIRNTRICIVPIVNMVFSVGFISLWLYGFIYLFSCGEIILPTNGSQFKDVNFYDDNLRYQVYAFIFGLFWIYELICAIF